MKVVTTRCVLVLERASRSVPGERLARVELPLGCQHFGDDRVDAAALAEDHLNRVLGEIEFADTIGGQIEELLPQATVKGSAVIS